QTTGIYQCRVEVKSLDGANVGNGKTVVMKSISPQDIWLTGIGGTVPKKKLELTEYPRAALKEINATQGTNSPKYLVGDFYWVELDKGGILALECPKELYSENLRIYRFEPYFPGIETFDFAAYGQTPPPLGHWVKLEKQYVDPLGWEQYRGQQPFVFAEIEYGGLFAVLSVADTSAPEIKNITCTPATFSPDNDKVDDITAISYTLSDDYSTHIPWTTIEIYNSQNALVRTLIKEVRRDFGKNEEVWDGKDDTGKIVPVGTYTIKIKAVDLTGNIAESTGVVEVFYTQIVDITPPTKPVIDDGGDYTSSLTELYALWHSEDPDSKIIDSKYTVEGQEQIVIGNWEIAGKGWLIADNLLNHVSFEYNSWMYIIGGENTPNKMYYQTIDSLGKVSGSWQSVFLPLSYKESSAVLYNGRIYLLGKGINSVYVGKIDSLTHSLTTDGWKPTIPLPTGIDAYRTVICNGRIYVFPFLSTKIYYSDINPDDGSLVEWKRTTTNLPLKRIDYTLTSYGTRIYIIGGSLYDPPYGPTGSAIYTEVTNSGDIITWKTTLSLPDGAKRLSHSSTVNGSGVIYVTGGLDSNWAKVNTVFYGIIDTITGEIGSWGYGTSLPSKIDGYSRPYPADHSSIIYDDWLYVIGGYGTKDTEYATIQKLRITTKGWTDVDSEQSVRVSG
ncbi:MAG: FlgD immunoglobulin-like domain containing protein, partial [Elusimicrobiota bacterium]